MIRMSQVLFAENDDDDGKRKAGRQGDRIGQIRAEGRQGQNIRFYALATSAVAGVGYAGVNWGPKLMKLMAAFL